MGTPKLSPRRLPWLLLVLPVLWLVLLAWLIALYLVTFIPGSHAGPTYRSNARAWCRVFVYSLGIDLKLVMATTLPIPAHYILIANHPSVLEDFAIPGLFDITPLAKAGVRDWYFLGRISAYAGTVFVQREAKASRKHALQRLIDAAAAGSNLVIFPEGGCKGIDIYHTFRTGAFEVSLQTGVPVLPVYLQYKDERGFEWTSQSMPQKLIEILLLPDRRVRYIVMSPIEPDQFSDKQQYANFARQQFVDWQARSRQGTWG
jgi:1-acyl-sn-glycerol-3-phosphate acyltransferase